MRIHDIISVRILEQFLGLPRCVWHLCVAAIFFRVVAVVCLAVAVFCLFFCRLWHRGYFCPFPKQKTWKSIFYPGHSGADSTRHSLSHTGFVAPEQSCSGLAICETLCKVLHEASLVRGQCWQSFQLICFPDHPLPGLRPAMMFTLAVFPQVLHIYPFFSA